jgi:predicted NBD/HSP70 family sugar kinase
MRRISPTTFQIARRGTPREVNRQIALNLVRSKQPISRAELARLMGVRRGAVTRLVDELLESGQVFEGAKGESRRGRKPRLLYIDTRRECMVAVDITATRTFILVADALGHPLLRVRDFPTPPDPPGVISQISRRVKRLLEDNPKVGRCLGIGVAISGVVDPERGRARFSPTLGWRDVDLREPLKESTGLPVVVENSVKACVLAQVWAVLGDAPVDGPVAFVNVSDGVGVGIAVDGKLLRGAHNIAGEFGHVPLDANGPRCACGQNGCWEAYVSKRALVARYLGTDPGWPQSAGRSAVTIEEVIARARTGEPRALETLRETGLYLGRGFATLVKAIDPRKVYLGGEITAAWDLVEPSVRESLRALALTPEAAITPIFPVALGDHPRLRGAAALVSAPAFAAPIVA